MGPYKRVVLKLSGEALRDKGSGDSFSHDRIDGFVKELLDVRQLGTELSVVIGGGNIFRGHTYNGRHTEFIRTDADKMGMLATAINVLAVRSALEHYGIDTVIQSAIGLEGIAHRFSVTDCNTALKSGKIVLFCCGTGNPFFSTDSAAALRACELQADIVLKATNVDGVYESDPLQNSQAKRFATLTYSDVLQQHLKVMDLTAFVLCMENHIPIRIFSAQKEGSIVRAVRGEAIGTLIKDTEN